MPMYDYKCEKCGRVDTLFLKLSELDLPQKCSVCSQPRQRQISAPRVVADYTPYNCPITGKLVEGRRAHRENLARHGCRVLEPGEQEAAKRFRKAADAKLEADVEATVERTIHEMPSEKREALAADLQHFNVDAIRT